MFLAENLNFIPEQFPVQLFQVLHIPERVGVFVCHFYFEHMPVNTRLLRGVPFMPGNRSLARSLARLHSGHLLS